jgi:cytosine/adenosine deaminase-related metal-dependent hydrolase
MEKDLGSLEARMKADAILMDMVKPHRIPLNMPVYRVACVANGADVDTVIVHGEVLRGHPVDRPCAPAGDSRPLPGRDQGISTALRSTSAGLR